MGDRRVPRAEDGLAPRRHLIAAAVAAPLALAGCGSARLAEVSFENDLPRPVQVGFCDDTACRVVRSWVPVDEGATATEQLPVGRKTTRVVVAGPPDTVYGCLALRLTKPASVSVRLSTAHGCGSGR